MHIISLTWLDEKKLNQISNFQIFQRSVHNRAAVSLLIPPINTYQHWNASSIAKIETSNNLTIYIWIFIRDVHALSFPSRHLPRHFRSTKLLVYDFWPRHFGHAILETTFWTRHSRNDALLLLACVWDICTHRHKWSNAHYLAARYHNLTISTPLPFFYNTWVRREWVY